MRLMRSGLPVLAAALAAPHARAHLVGSAAVDGAHGANLWLPDPVAVVLLALAGYWYWSGSRSNPTTAGTTGRRAAGRFWCGWTALVVVLASPIDPLGEQLFSVHMVQHELMMLVAAPLLVASRPLAALLRGVPRSLALAVGGGLRISGAGRWTAWLRSPAVAWTIHAIGLWAWHWPTLFSAGLTNSWVHALQHLTFLWVALIFWNAVIRPQQAAPAAAVLYLFTTAIHASALGALLTFSPEVWYRPYLATAPQWGLTALEDQQLGGLIMWVPGGLVFVAAGLWALGQLLGRDEGPDRSGGQRP